MNERWDAGQDFGIRIMWDLSALDRGLVDVELHGSAPWTEAAVNHFAALAGADTEHAESCTEDCSHRYLAGTLFGGDVHTTMSGAGVLVAKFEVEPDITRAADVGQSLMYELLFRLGFSTCPHCNGLDPHEH